MSHTDTPTGGRTAQEARAILDISLALWDRLSKAWDLLTEAEQRDLVQKAEDIAATDQDYRQD